MAQYGNGDAPKFTVNGLSEVGGGGSGVLPGGTDTSPRMLGMPLKYISLVTLAVQNALLTIIMHHSRVSTPASRTYSAASAVLLNEFLKGLISLVIAYHRVDEHGVRSQPPLRRTPLHVHSRSEFMQSPSTIVARCRRLGREVFSPDCWKLSIPAILYVIQNNLQFVAASNLEAATFQVTYQMKILTTAAFSVLLLGRRLSTRKWLALLALAVGVGIVQIQAGAGRGSVLEGGHEMVPMKGFMAVVAACFTSGLAGVYFEMVLKNSQADLWVRNVQLSLFSLLPALAPVLASPSASADGVGWFWTLFAHFGPWAWATVATQVVGGLVTAVVIKYSDNILKGFATSLSIVISFLASVALFGFRITPSFVVGSCTVLAATWLYNQPDTAGAPPMAIPKLMKDALESSRRSLSLSRRSSFEHVAAGSPILGLEADKKRSSFGGASPRAIAAALRLTLSTGDGPSGHGHHDALGLSSGQSSPLYIPSPGRSPTTTPPISRPPSRMPSSGPPSSVAGPGVGFVVPGPPSPLGVPNGHYGGEGRGGYVVRLDESPPR